MIRAFFCLGLAATFLTACSAPPPTARILVFTASHERIPRGEEVTLLWQAADAGVQDGMLSCVLTRRFGDDPTETALPASCSGGFAEVPPAPLSAASVDYRFEVLKQPYDASDPYLSETRSVILDPALYATRAGGIDGEAAQAVTTLPDGSAIVAGFFMGTTTFGPMNLASAGIYDVVVARIQPDGTWAWATRAGGTSIDLAQGVSSVADGGAIVTGFYFGTATFGFTNLTSAGLAEAFVARIRPDGTWAWATSAGGTSDDTAQGVSTLADGGAIVTGYFGGTATFGTTTLVSAGGIDVFVARIRPDGAWAWAASAGGMSSARGHGVTALADGGAIVAGAFDGTATFGATTLISGGLEDAFIARIHPDGTWAWATSAAGSNDDAGLGASALADGGAIVTGYFGATATFGTTTLTSVGGTDVFVARIDPDGTWAWATRAGGSGNDRAQGVSTLADGGAIVTGSFFGTATFGATTLTSAQSADAFVARIHPDGTWAWATSAGGTDNDRAHGVSTLADGGAVVAGTFDGTATFGATTLTSAGLDDAFVARIAADGAW